MRSRATIHEDFPFLHERIYFNSASCSPCPELVIAAMVDFYRHSPINYRSGTTPSEEFVRDQVDEIRNHVARFTGAESSKEIVFTKNTTEAINIVAQGLQMKRGDEIILSRIEHQSNLIPWMKVAAEKEIRLEYVEPDPTGVIAPDTIRPLISDKTRLVSLHHVSNLLGVEQDVGAMADIAHEHGALFLVDAAQSEGRFEVDVVDLRCDFMVSCARKGLMGPQGVGFLWGRERLLEELSPLTVGSQAALATGPTSYTVDQVPYRHEAGILNTVGVIGLGAALDYIEAIGTSKIVDYVEELSTHLLSVLGDSEGVEIYGPAPPRRSGIVSWNVKGKEPQMVARELHDSKRIMVSTGYCGSPLAAEFLGVPGVIRTSLHYFNDDEDVDALGAALKRIL